MLTGNPITNNETPLSPAIKKRLQTTVLDIFSRTDFHKVNMRTIAKKAGVGFGTIYKYYGSKEQLLFAFVDEWLSELTERMIDHLEGLENPKEKLRKVIWVMFDYFEKYPDVVRILQFCVPQQTWMADQSFEQKRMFNIFLDVVRQNQNRGILNPDAKAGVLIDCIIGFVNRRATMWIYEGQTESLVEQSKVVFDILWQGISNPQQQ